MEWFLQVSKILTIDVWFDGEKVDIIPPNESANLMFRAFEKHL
jgi:hypothetical protein